MSTQNDIPDPSVATGSGESGDAHSPETAAPPTPETGSGDPELDRILAGGQDAVESYKKLKSAETRHFKQVQQYEKNYAPLNTIIDQLGGAANVAQHLQTAALAVTDPRVKRVWDHVASHGTLPTSSEPEDDYMDDEQDNPRVAQLEAELNSLKQRQSEGEYNHGVERVQSYFKKLNEEHAPYWDELKEHLDQTFDSWKTSPDGREAIRRLDYDALEMIAGKWVIKNRDKVVSAMNGQLVKNQQSRSTGQIPQTGTNGREAARELKHTDVLSAWKQGEREGAW